MNSLKGLGVCAIIAGLAYAMTRVADIYTLLLYFSITIVVLSLLGYAASIRRRRRDRRVAVGATGRRAGRLAGSAR
ncbi:hypothetical protein [Streptomyces sp. PR69]|uniref:hypothetical protein n=1 Tax=Streptomyces sp. PR69 TaxID=2984950 RepID=UPI002264BE29|nr:hypothetical protein [Streptomyces sp. PR69]